MPEPTLTIGEVAAAAGLNTSAMRYYERVGVLPKPERVSGQRRYHREVINRLRTIQAAQHAGFSLEEIAQLLRGAEDGRAADELRMLAERKLPDIEALIERAETMKHWLELAAQCRCGSLDVCSLFRGDVERAELGEPDRPGIHPSEGPIASTRARRPRKWDEIGTTKSPRSRPDTTRTL